MKVSISFASGKLLVPVGEGDKPISWLMEEFATRYAKREGKPIAVKELRTKAGESLDKDDAIRDLVEDNAELVAVLEGCEAGAAGSAAPGAGSDAGAAATVTAKAILDEVEQRMAQTVYECVQCGAKYRDAENGEGHCRFHAAPPETRGWRQQYTCCAGDKPCKGGKHRPEHHMDYPYAGFMAFARAVNADLLGKWLSVKRMDFEGEWNISADVGALKGGRLFTRVYRGNKLAWLKTFKPEELAAEVAKADAAKGRVSAGKWSDSEVAGRFVEFFFAPASTVGVVFHMASDTVPTEKTAQFSLDKDVLTLVGVATVSEKPAYKYDSGLTYALNPVKHTGPELPPDVSPEPVVYQCEGGSRLLMSADGRTRARQDGIAREGKFGNYFLTTIDLKNPSDEDISVVKASGEVMLGGAFVPAAAVLVGYLDGYGDAQFPEGGGLPVRVEKRGAVKIVVSVKVIVEGQPGCDNLRRNRAHVSLPQPMKVRMVLEDAVGKSVSLVAEQFNPSLRLPNPETMAKDWKCGPLAAWFQCDDTEALERTFVGVYVAPSGSLTWRAANTYFTVGDEFWEGIAYKAKKLGQTEYPLDMLKSSSTQLTALVDVKLGVVYAVRVKITTKTGCTEGDFKLPDMNAARAQICVKPEVAEVKAEAKFSVAYRALVPSDDSRLKLARCEQADDDSVESEYVKGASGTVEFTAPKQPGKYEVRFAPGDDTSKVVARSAPIVVL